MHSLLNTSLQPHIVLWWSSAKTSIFVSCMFCSCTTCHRVPRERNFWTSSSTLCRAKVSPWVPAALHYCLWRPGLEPALTRFCGGELCILCWWHKHVIVCFFAFFSLPYFVVARWSTHVFSSPMLLWMEAVSSELVATTQTKYRNSPLHPHQSYPTK